MDDYLISSSFIFFKTLISLFIYSIKRSSNDIFNLLKLHFYKNIDFYFSNYFFIIFFY